MIFKQSGLSQAGFGKVLGKSQGLISDILNNRSNISGDMIQLLGYKMNVNLDYLLHGKQPMYRFKRPKETFHVPIIADIPAGPWQYWIDSYAAGAGDDYVAAPDVKGKNLFAVRVDGDSMEPVLFEGDILVIDPHKEYRHGLAVVRHHWGYKIRNVYKQNERRYYLCPQNSTYESEEITADNETRIYVPVKVISMRDI